ncbi:AraC family transcriptional regulator [Allomesorhizobium alhagi]|uniref:AraC family transcriptional regulator n=1 Tax=Mesorhizobium alhagi CCNWXJ12-2 TaxID=1107882 RepID=H0HY17_9HYPH|nr:helix-turn-helix domain-containing protein [Mesorhizobium alhagi]EHK54383.1 AraC family transcriptional regulator [Mesorhizobium alhagi CCNWXJ12-2]
MLFAAREPRFPLFRFVSQLWYGENAPNHSHESFLPTGEFDLVINTRDGVLRIYDPEQIDEAAVFSGPLVAGPHTRPYVIDTGQQASLLGAKFRPGGAYAIFGLPADALRDRHVPLESLWGSSASQLQEEAMAAATPETRIAVLERAMSARLTAHPSPHPAVAHAISRFHTRHGVDLIAAVAGEVDLSSHRFIDVFRREVGLAPKLYCRLLRFRRIMRDIAQRPDTDLTSLALDCGYYDQSHMIREFKSFSGLTPSAYREADGRYDNHVPLER